MIVALVIFWLACSAFSYAITLAYFQRKYPAQACKSDLVFSVITAVLGPGALIVSFAYCGFKYGLKWK